MKRRTHTYYCVMCKMPLKRTATRFCDDCREKYTNGERWWLSHQCKTLKDKPLVKRCVRCSEPLYGRARKYCPKCRPRAKLDCSNLWYYATRKNFGQQGGKREGAGRKKKPLNTP